jgi:hypothetical protein
VPRRGRRGADPPPLCGRRTARRAPRGRGRARGRGTRRARPPRRAGGRRGNGAWWDMASAIWRAMGRAAAGAMGPGRCSIQARREGPSRRSMTRYAVPSASVSAVMTRTTPGCSMRARARASCTKRPASWGSAAAAERILRATSRSMRSWIAANTVAMPPWPRGRRRRYGPTLVGVAAGRVVAMRGMAYHNRVGADRGSAARGGHAAGGLRGRGRGGGTWPLILAFESTFGLWFQRRRTETARRAKKKKAAPTPA